jgi:type II secretory pathway pseudopilin PulG
METVIAIGVLAVLLTGFLAVFTPAAQGIRRSISTQQADRLASTLERELVTLQGTTSYKTGFEKAFEWLEDSNDAANAIFVYQYRGDSSAQRSDGTPRPMKNITGQPGDNYVVQSIARRLGDPEFREDLDAIEGPIFYVKTTQLVNDGNGMKPGTPGQIANPGTGARATSADNYTDAVIAFSAEFHSVPTRAYNYLSGAKFKERFASNARPVFTRNLAVRR